MNNGTCISDSKYPGIYMCECLPSFVGENCEQKIHLCDRINPCLNGGQCSKSVSDYGDNDFTCICHKGFYGLTCEIGMVNFKNNNLTLESTYIFVFYIELDPCDPNPCYNGATCRKFATGSFSCK